MRIRVFRRGSVIVTGMTHNIFVADLTGRFSPSGKCDSCGAELEVDKVYAVVAKMNSELWITHILCPECGRKVSQKYKALADEELLQVIANALSPEVVQ